MLCKGEQSLICKQLASVPTNQRGRQPKKIDKKPPASAKPATVVTPATANKRKSIVPSIPTIKRGVIKRLGEVKAEDVSYHASYYAAYARNRQMVKAQDALNKNRNKMYSEDDVGEITAGNDVDIPELIKFKKSRETKKDALITEYEKNRAKESTNDTNKFSLTAEDASLSDSSAQEKEALRILTAAQLPKGYMARLTELDTFHQWARLCIDNNDVGKWFDELFRLTSTKDGSFQFNIGCRAIQDKLLRIAARCMRKRCDGNTSFEADAHNDEICGAHLPGNLGKSHPGCMLLGLMLEELLVDWLALALRMFRERNNPELFRQKQNDIKPAEANNEVNSFVGWSIFSAMKKFVDTDENELDTECKELLKSMSLSEADAYKDEEYLAKYYDTNMSMLNHGGLTLVSKQFFEWGKLTMKTIRDAFTLDHIQRAPRNCFNDGKRRVLQNKSIHSHFLFACKSIPSFLSHAAMNKVYHIILPKMIHARFAVVFRDWKQLHCQKLYFTELWGLAFDVGDGSTSVANKQKGERWSNPVQDLAIRDNLGGNIHVKKFLRDPNQASLGWRVRKSKKHRGRSSGVRRTINSRLFKETYVGFASPLVLSYKKLNWMVICGLSQWTRTFVDRLRPCDEASELAFNAQALILSWLNSLHGSTLSRRWYREDFRRIANNANMRFLFDIVLGGIIGSDGSVGMTKQRVFKIYQSNLFYCEELASAARTRYGVDPRVETKVSRTLRWRPLTYIHFNVRDTEKLLLRVGSFDLNRPDQHVVLMLKVLLVNGNRNKPIKNVGKMIALLEKRLLHRIVFDMF